MNIVDIIIIVLLILGVLIGFKRGFIRELVTLIGMFAVLVLSFILKNPVSVFLYNNLPFFNFGGILKDITVLNILVYEMIAFLIVFLVLTAIFEILIKVTKVFESILKATIILGIPSKILGAVLGLIESIVLVFISLYILSLPIFNISSIKESKLSSLVLNNTPILHSVCDKTLDTFNEIIELKNEYENTNNVKEFNEKALNIMIDKGIITKENAIKLIKKGKIKNITIE